MKQRRNEKVLASGGSAERLAASRASRRKKAFNYCTAAPSTSPFPCRARRGGTAEDPTPGRCTRDPKAAGLVWLMFYRADFCPEWQQSMGWRLHKDLQVMGTVVTRAMVERSHKGFAGHLQNIQ